MLEQKKKNKTTNGASLEIGLKRRQYTQEKKMNFDVNAGDGPTDAVVRAGLQMWCFLVTDSLVRDDFSGEESACLITSPCSSF